jgi:hypothetical protein
MVENVVGDLLNLVEEAASADNDHAALAAVKSARKTRIADEKLKLISGVIPLSLRPGGVNPFARLYDDYSRGIHTLSDEDCLSIATDLREAFDYVFGNVRDQLEQAKAFRERLNRPQK